MSLPLFGHEESDAARPLIVLALQEDLGRIDNPSAGDVTSRTVIPSQRQGEVAIVSRQDGRLAGLPLIELILEHFSETVDLHLQACDGQAVNKGGSVGQLRGSVRAILAAERTILNFLSHLSGIATLTRAFVDAVSGTKAAILDTRKTLPGYRLLQKYAVRCGGGVNHRIGLFDAVMLKDNHLAACGVHGTQEMTKAVQTVRARCGPGMEIVVEVDSLEQLGHLLAAGPDIILLDNMSPAQLQEACRMRDAQAPTILLEASGGITLETVRAVAESGVDRISIGQLTHSAPSLDLGFDWIQ